MRVIGARQTPTSGDLAFQSSDGKSGLTFCYDEDHKKSLQVDINGNWIWLGPEDIKRLRAWLSRAA